MHHTIKTIKTNASQQSFDSIDDALVLMSKMYVAIIEAERESRSLPEFMIDVYFETGHIVTLYNKEIKQIFKHNLLDKILFLSRKKARKRFLKIVFWRAGLEYIDLKIVL